MNLCCTTISPITLSQILISLFLSICFLQSGIDKIIDRKGSLDWLIGHFSKTLFKNIVPFVLSLITLLELAGGALCAYGIIHYAINGNSIVMFYGLFIVAITIICLFLGQRLAKDYEGAAVLVGYFIVDIIGILSFF